MDTSSASPSALSTFVEVLIAPFVRAPALTRAWLSAVRGERAGFELPLSTTMQMQQLSFWLCKFG